MMTTASRLTNRGTAIPGTAFDYGAGHVDPVKAMDPGLVYGESHAPGRLWVS
jgi:hypothetical protein